MFYRELTLPSVFLARIYFHLGIDETDIAAITLVL